MAADKNQQLPVNQKPRTGPARTTAGETITCCEGASNGECPDAGCRIEAVVTVDGRGQLVLPKEVRLRAGIRAGERMLIVGWERNGRVCCLTLLKSEFLAPKVREFVTP